MSLFNSKTVELIELLNKNLRIPFLDSSQLATIKSNRVCLTLPVTGQTNPTYLCHTLDCSLTLINNSATNEPKAVARFSLLTLLIAIAGNSMFKITETQLGRRSLSFE